MKKVTLYNPKVDRVYYKKGEGVPLALLAASSILDREGYSIGIYDHWDEESLLADAEGSICFGITSMTGYQIYDGLRVAKKIRNKYPAMPVIWGGWHPTLLPEQTLQNEFVDIVVRGQGERGFAELVHALEKGGTLDGIEGICYKIEGKIHLNPNRAFEDINNFPPLPYHLLELDEYIASSRLGKRTVNYISSQGCPHHCGFCPEMRVHNRKWKALKPERVISDITNLVNKYGIDAVIFSDSEFFIDEDRVRQICKGLLPLGIQWGRVNGRADRLIHYQSSTWELLQKSGLRSLLVGAESGVQECLDAMKKDASIEDTLELARIAGKYGVTCQFSFFIGTPILDNNYSVEKEFRQTMNFISRLYDINPSNEFLLSSYTPFAGTDLFEIAKQKGFIEPARLEDWAEFGLYKETAPWIPGKYVRLCEQISYYLFFATGGMQRTIKNLPGFIRFILSIAEFPLRMLMRMRVKKQFYKFPIEFTVIQLLMKMF